MARPNVQIIKGQGQIAGVPVSEDSVSLLCISRPAGYTMTGSATSALVTSLREAEELGLTEAADDTNNALVWEHIKDFYVNAPTGTKLHILLFADTLTFEALFTAANAANIALKTYLATQGGEIRKIGVVLNPSYAEVGGSGISADLAAGIPLAAAFAEAEFVAYRPCSIVLEGRLFTGAVGSSVNLRTLDSPFVAVMISRDGIRQDALNTAVPVSANYAAVGYMLGVFAAQPVQRNIGRVKNGALLGIRDPELSGGQKLSTQADSDLDILHDRGYIFFTRHAGLTGFYFNDDNTATALTDDYRQLSLCETINKAARISRAVYVNEILEEIRVDPETGRLDLLEVKRLENLITSSVEAQMVANNEIVAVSATIDPNQDIITTSALEAILDVTPFGYARAIRVVVQFRNPNQ